MDIDKRDQKKKKKPNKTQNQSPGCLTQVWNILAG